MTASSPRPRTAAAAALAALVCAAAAGAAPAAAGPTAAPAAVRPVEGADGGAVAGAQAAPPLPLGPAALREVRTSQRLQPGVVRTSVVRGAPDPSLRWTVEVAVPDAASPDPDAPATAIAPRDDARATAARLRAAGLDARAERVVRPATADTPGGTLGWRVRVGATRDRAAADALAAAVAAAGARGSVVWTGWDGDRGDRGPWRLEVLTVDPRTFRGSLTATYGPDLERRETTSDLARSAGATAAVNGGFFVLDPAAGAPGDPAGVGAYGRGLVSEPVGERPALVLREDARRTAVERLGWRGSVQGPGGRALRLDGVDRVPGLVRNCGGLDDLPTTAPLHDGTCTDADEVVAFTAAFGATTPGGPGVEVVLDRRGRVRAVLAERGTALRPGWTSLQGTGASAAALRGLARPGAALRLRTLLRDDDGKRFPLQPGTSVVNGGPELVRDGRLHVTPARDGMERPDDPSFAYGWAVKRNPRTFAGVDRQGRTVLVTADGRSTGSLGLSLTETARVARALGLVDAVNLDGGGSTTAVVRGEVVNRPSDAAGERPVGDAVLVLPRRRG
ncbi:phosphodiester glycosidase family protein [Vallicoccus soli]|uniref:Phosphodiester glycosidase family protein n=1 Tax=Vallicoccus soli TaxID=2339232 RepID=A0A3A3YVS6_9ACTN|nr:phosphodiester glycosidase family protein [Vallicoccus soli]RJK94797.1 phosphodiester glycosidase family protein [Vallicoccus soli]